ncbi:MAG: type II secretion system F family protein, partial [Phycisphaerae bacterium]|nr:type II secretion system F family protein [Phycisphaerae bacterium]
EEAISKVRNMGLFLTKEPQQVSARKVEAVAGVPAKKVSTPMGRVSQKRLTQFTRQLSTLIDAGLPILRCLTILEQQQKPGILRVTLRGVREDVEGGASLSEAMGRHPKAFDRLYVNMVAAGETGGVLDTILSRLADFLEKAQWLRRRVIGAMIYPIAVITVAALIVTGIMVWVIPKFEAIFEGMGTDMPKITQILLGMSNWFAGGGWLVVLFAPLGVFILSRILRLSRGGRMLTDKIKLRIPLIGKILSKTAVARFTRTLGTLIEAGVPILEALNITRNTSGNEVFARAIGEVHDSVREGETFADPLRNSKVCDPIVVNMVDVGEETGDLDKMLLKVADNYDEEVDATVAALVSVMEPVMVIVLGVIVGFIVLGIFMPMPAMIEGATATAGGR